MAPFGERSHLSSCCQVAVWIHLCIIGIIQYHHNSRIHTRTFLASVSRWSKLWTRGAGDRTDDPALRPHDSKQLILLAVCRNGCNGPEVSDLDILAIQHRFFCAIFEEMIRLSCGINEVKDEECGSPHLREAVWADSVTGTSRAVAKKQLSYFLSPFAKLESIS